MRPEQRLVTWLDTVSDLLGQPLTEVPTATLEAALFGTFELSAVSWCRRDDERTFGYTVTAEPGRWLADPAHHESYAPEALARHPLVRWHEATGDHRALRINDVPLSVASRADRDATLEILRPLDSDRQLSMPYLLDGTRYRSFVLCRSGADFDRDDVLVARRLQPLLRAIHKQVDILSSGAEPGGRPSAVRAERS